MHQAQMHQAQMHQAQMLMLLSPSLRGTPRSRNCGSEAPHPSYPFHRNTGYRSNDTLQSTNPSATKWSLWHLMRDSQRDRRTGLPADAAAAERRRGAADVGLG